MNVFRITMENNGETHYYHLMDIPSNHPIKERSEHFFGGTYISSEEKTLTDKDMLVSMMQEGVSYEVLADSDNTNDTIIFRKEGDKIYTTVRGGEFPEDGTTFYFVLGEYLKDIEFLEELDLSNPTIEDLIWIEFEVYSQIAMLQSIPDEFIDKIGTL